MVSVVCCAAALLGLRVRASLLFQSASENVPRSKRPSESIPKGCPWKLVVSLPASPRKVSLYLRLMIGPTGFRSGTAGPGVFLLWGTEGGHPVLGARDDAVVKPYFPALGGTRFLVVRWAPGRQVPEPAGDPAEISAEAERLLPGLLGVIEPDNSGMHTTDTATTFSAPMARSGWNSMMARKCILRLAAALFSAQPSRMAQPGRQSRHDDYCPDRRQRDQTGRRRSARARERSAAAWSQQASASEPLTQADSAADESACRHGLVQGVLTKSSDSRFSSTISTYLIAQSLPRKPA